MFIVDMPVGSSKRTLGLSGFLQLMSKVSDTVLHIDFTKWDLPVPPAPERNI